MENNLTDAQCYNLVNDFDGDFEARVKHFSSEVLAGWSRVYHGEHPLGVEYFDHQRDIATGLVAYTPPVRAPRDPIVEARDQARRKAMFDELEQERLDVRRPGFVPIAAHYPELFGHEVEEEKGPGFFASTAAVLLGVAVGYKASSAMRKR